MKPPSYGGDVLGEILGFPRKVVLVSISVTIFVILILLYLYTTSGDRNILLAILIVSLIIPVDIAVLGILLKEEGKRLTSIIEFTVKIVKPQVYSLSGSILNYYISMHVGDNVLLIAKMSSKHFEVAKVIIRGQTKIEPLSKYKLAFLKLNPRGLAMQIKGQWVLAGCKAVVGEYKGEVLIPHPSIRGIALINGVITYASLKCTKGMYTLEHVNYMLEKLL